MTYVITFQVCQNCRLTCHKKCYQKSHICNKNASPGNNNLSHNDLSNSTLFGVPLNALCSADGGVRIPVKIDQLITKIEMHGLYAEGIYRKSGVTSKIKELKGKMSDILQASAEIDYESYNVHVLANVLKTFLRDMPEPLLSFDRYDDFLRASELSEPTERVSTLMSLIKKLPTSHHALLERLVFHLALVAQREQYNRMSASSLAIVFAPCVLRTNRQIPAQDSLNDIGRQTKCIETLITQKMMNVKSTLADIDTLDTAAHTATTRLSTLRSSKVFTPEELVAPRPSNVESDQEETLLEDHIQEIKKEKALLTSTLPSLARATSDDDLLSTDMDGEGGSLDDLSSKDNGGGCDTSTRDMKDSMDSSCGGFSDSASRRTIESDSTSIGGAVVGAAESDSAEPAAVSYNLREQNIDYIQQAPIRQHQQRLDRDSYAVPKSISAASMTGSTSSSGVSSTASTRWTGSQQNLTYHNMLGGASIGSSELQRQKPLAVRSMSGGYDAASISGSTLIQGAVLPPNVIIGGNVRVMEHHHHHHHHGSGAGSKGTGNGNADKDNSSRNNNNRNTKGGQGQHNMDDEPIMV